MMKWCERKRQHGNQGWPQGEPYDIAHVHLPHHTLFCYMEASCQFTNQIISKHPMIQAIEEEKLHWFDYVQNQKLGQKRRVVLQDKKNESKA